MSRAEYEKRAKMLKHYLRYGRKPSSDYFRLRRDRKGRGIYVYSQSSRRYIAVIDPSVVRIARDQQYRSIFENFAKKQKRRIIILDSIKEQRNMRDCHQTNWYIKDFKEYRVRSKSKEKKMFGMDELNAYVESINRPATVWARANGVYRPEFMQTYTTAEYATVDTDTLADMPF
jgi:hypothetical protein